MSNDKAENDTEVAPEKGNPREELGEELDLDEEDEEILNAVWAQIAAKTKANPDRYKKQDEWMRQRIARNSSASDPETSSE